MIAQSNFKGARILKITEIAAGGLFVFYLLICWVVVPLVAPWVIRSQGRKILKTPVQARAAAFNPFLWRLTLKEVGARATVIAQALAAAGFNPQRFAFGSAKETTMDGGSIPLEFALTVYGETAGEQVPVLAGGAGEGSASGGTAAPPNTIEASTRSP